mmetsp:Transcript_14323/g.39003  ORF Transcript_14323/g.39003 Transcript_14323/m.39003 type:complete len:207 (-) Transcript_14323:589-1209(-)
MLEKMTDDSSLSKRSRSSTTRAACGGLGFTVPEKDGIVSTNSRPWLARGRHGCCAPSAKHTSGLGCVPRLTIPSSQTLFEGMSQHKVSHESVSLHRRSATLLASDVELEVCDFPVVASIRMFGSIISSLHWRTVLSEPSAASGSLAPGTPMDSTSSAVSLLTFGCLETRTCEAACFSSSPMRPIIVRTSEQRSSRRTGDSGCTDGT